MIGADPAEVGARTKTGTVQLSALLPRRVVEA
jgi:hypothetical protein